MKTMSQSKKSEWQTVNHALAYLPRADKLPHRVEGERVLLDLIPTHIRRVYIWGQVMVDCFH